MLSYNNLSSYIKFSNHLLCVFCAQDIRLDPIKLYKWGKINQKNESGFQVGYLTWMIKQIIWNRYFDEEIPSVGGHLGGTVSWASDSWFLLGSWFWGCGIKPCVGLHAWCWVCLWLSISFFLPPLSLSLSLIINK